MKTWKGLTYEQRLEEIKCEKEKYRNNPTIMKRLEKSEAITKRKQRES